MRVEAEDEGAVVDEELDLRHLRDARVSRDPPGERLRQKRAREVRDARLEQPEVGAADMGQVRRCLLHTVRDREQSHDQADAEADADGGEGRA